MDEHEVRRTIVEDEYYPAHDQRSESEIFRRTKAAGERAGLRCAVSGRADGLEYHHVFLEWADADGVDWATVKGVATGTILALPVLDAHTDMPSGESYPAEQSLIWVICRLAAARGFDWASFDPSKPETFVDSPANMLVLNEKFHRAKFHGIHAETFPVWVFQAWPRVAGFVISPDDKKS